MSESKPINPELQQLRGIYNPTAMNVIDQCRIIHDALQPSGDFPRSNKRLGQFLNISPNKVYKMKFVHQSLIPELKEWFKGTLYQMNTAYGVATLAPEKQKVWLAEVKAEIIKPVELTTDVPTITPQELASTNASNPNS